MAHWSDIADAVRYYLCEGYRVARMRCGWCEHFQVSVFPPGCKCTKFECNHCGKKECTIVEEFTGCQT